MGPPSSREVISRLLSEGWIEVRTKGDHHQFQHPQKKGTVTVPHPKKQLHWMSWNGIKKQAGWK